MKTVKHHVKGGAGPGEGVASGTSRGRCGGGRRAGRFIGPGLLLLGSLGGGVIAEPDGGEDRQGMARAEAYIREEAARIKGGALSPGPKNKTAAVVTAPATDAPGPDALRWAVSIADLSVDEAALALDPDRHALVSQAEADRAEARQLAFQGEHQEAIRKLERWVGEGTPEAVREAALMDLAEYAFRLSDYPRSQEAIKKLRAHRPANAALLCNQAAAYMQTGRYEEALTLLESIETGAIKRPALLAAVFFNRACAHSRLGRVDSAISALYTAFKAHPEATSIWLTDPQLDGIRADLRYKVLEKIALRQRTPPLQSRLKADLVLHGRPDADAEPQGERSSFLFLDKW
ncbi:MAG: tetratricopeptide repeat protein [Kiritimatiellae bacterium]|nr:tetratricopeptide repeat protein [Kiritimatiellia bacterium]